MTKIQSRKPAGFHGTDICDGWAMSHDGMNYILASREILCDLVEVHGRVIPWDGLVAISSCEGRGIWPITDCAKKTSSTR
jgi:dihydroxyacid dehydratase/phosphogluconate dehydratase